MNGRFSGGSGLGPALCLTLARDGARVLVVDLDDERAGDTPAQITMAGGRASACPVDVGTPPREARPRLREIPG